MKSDTKYNSLTRMFMWCNGLFCNHVYIQYDGFNYVMADYNHHGRIGREELVCVGLMHPLL